jgi:hypothetical protein
MLTLYHRGASKNEPVEEDIFEFAATGQKGDDLDRVVFDVIEHAPWPENQFSIIRNP